MLNMYDYTHTVDFAYSDHTLRFESFRSVSLYSESRTRNPSLLSTCDFASGEKKKEIKKTPRFDLTEKSHDLPATRGGQEKMPCLFEKGKSARGKRPPSASRACPLSSRNEVIRHRLWLPCHCVTIVATAAAHYRVIRDEFTTIQFAVIEPCARARARTVTLPSARVHLHRQRNSKDAQRNQRETSIL